MEHIIEIAKYVGSFIVGCVVVYTTCKKELKKYFDGQKSKVSRNLPKQSKLDIQIIERMERTKELLNADVVQVYEFHNGEHWSDGRSAMKLSCTYEVDKAGLLPIRKNCMYIPIACIPKFIDRILNTGKFTCSDLEIIKNEMPATYEFKKSNGIAAFADFAIKNKYGQTIAFAAVIWNDKERYMCDEKEIEKLTFYIEERLDDMPRD